MNTPTENLPKKHDPILAIQERIGSLRWRRMLPMFGTDVMENPVIFVEACRFIQVTGTEVVFFYNYLFGFNAWDLRWKQIESQIEQSEEPI